MLMHGHPGNHKLALSNVIPCGCRCEELRTGQQAEVKSHQHTQAQLRQLEEELQSAQAEQQSAGTSHEQTQRQLKQVQSGALLVKATFTSMSCVSLADFCLTDLECHPSKQTISQVSLCVAGLT